MSAAATACPHCGIVLDPPPKSNRKCPECREPLVVRTSKGNKLVLTPAGAEQYDRDRQREIAANKARRHAANIGVDDAGWRRVEQELTERFGQPPSAGDVFWSLANQMAMEAAQAGDWHRAQMTYFSMGLHLKDEGRDHMQVRREAMRCAVRDHIAQAARYGTDDPPLQILGCRPDCETCAPDAGRMFRASQLLAEDAPVPHECDWCACGVIFEQEWLEQQTAEAMTQVAEAAGERKRRGILGWLRRS